MNENEIYLNKIKELLIEKKDINRERVERELEAIKISENSKRVYLAYLITSIIRKENLKFLTRGQIGNSYVAYLLGITNINPLVDGNETSERNYSLPYECAFGCEGHPISPPLEFGVDSKHQENLINKISKEIFSNKQFGKYYQAINPISKAASKNAFYVFPPDYLVNPAYKQLGDVEGYILPVLEAEGVITDGIKFYILKDQRITMLNKMVKKFGEASYAEGTKALMEFIQNDDYGDLTLCKLKGKSKSIEDIIYSLGEAHSILGKTRKKKIVFREDIINLLKENNPIKDVVDLSEEVRRGRVNGEEYESLNFISPKKKKLLKEFRETKYLFTKPHVLEEINIIIQLAYFKKHYYNYFKKLYEEEYGKDE